MRDTFPQIQIVSGAWTMQAKEQCPPPLPMDDSGNYDQRLYKGLSGTGTGQACGKSMRPQLQGSSLGRSLKEGNGFFLQGQFDNPVLSSLTRRP